MAAIFCLQKKLTKTGDLGFLENISNILRVVISDKSLFLHGSGSLFFVDYSASREIVHPPA